MVDEVQQGNSSPTYMKRACMQFNTAYLLPLCLEPSPPPPRPPPHTEACMGRLVAGGDGVPLSAALLPPFPRSCPAYHRTRPHK
eukprot:355761-Chlamydomonas_euryale.AAC.3